MKMTTRSDERAGTDFVLETDGLRKSFGGFVAIERLDLRIRRNSIHALIGPNGAGKTTVFNLLTGFLRPTSGRIRFDGVDVTDVSSAALARQGLVRSFQISSVFGPLTTIENIRIALQRRLEVTYHFWRSDRCLRALNNRAEELALSVGLENHLKIEADALSYGRKRALELATTLALEPEVMLLDEPMAGLGHEDVSRIAELVRKASVGRTLVMVEHNLSVVADLSDTITVLARGSILAEGDYATVSKDQAVLEAYLGVAADA